MKFEFILAYAIIKIACGNIFSDMIIDYFVSKQVSSVVGFSCQTAEEDVILLRNLNERNIKATLLSINNDSILTVVGKVYHWKIGIFIDSRCYSLETMNTISSEMSNHRMFGDLYNWLIVGRNLTNTLSFINDDAFGLTTDFVITVPTQTGDFDFYDLYNVWKSRGGILNVTFIGKWNDEEGLIFRILQPKYIRRANLHTLNLTAIFFKCSYKPTIMALEEYFEDTQFGTKDGRTKFGYQLLKHLSDMYNFTLVPLESADWPRGDLLGPIVRGMANNTADLIGSAILMSIPKTYLFKFVHQDWHFRTCFIFRNPQPKNIKIQEILRPFSVIIWYLMLLTVIVGLLILAVALHFDYNGLDRTAYLRLSDSFIIIVGSLCQQGTGITMQRLSTRLIFMFLMVYSLLMYNYYSACVVSARLDEPIYKINDSLNQLRKLDLKYASEMFAYLEFLFRLPDWDIQQFNNKVWKKMTESEKYMKPEIGMELVRKGGFAYHVHPDVGYPFIERTYGNREICELKEVHLARPTFTAFGVTMNSTFEEIMRIGFIRLSEVGLSPRQEHRWTHRKPQCRPDVLNASSISIEEFSPHLIVLTIGMLLAIFVLCVEKIIMK